MTKPQIRIATKEDANLILKFITDLAIYEKAEHEVVATLTDIETSLFSEPSTAYGLICEVNKIPIGYAVYFFNYSTWLGKHGLYLEDLYISPEHRGFGGGVALLKHLANLAIENNCGRFEWRVLDWNEPAIQFYQSIGAKPQQEWIGYRLTGTQLESFARN
ncbi:MAG: GNAT family N-acetyltransferase [Gammaproteobacteria bacterium]|nr:GNAT family N-acetyltransferase [Gammaproteobacteria bacterium]